MERGYTPPLPTSSGANKFIPPYNPKTSVRSLEDWIAIVKNARGIWKWSECECVQRAGAMLEDDAGKWFADWLTPNPSLHDFEESLTRRCRAQFSFLTKYQKAIAYNSDNAKSYFDYCVEKQRLLKSVFVINDEENIVAIIIDGISERSTKSHLMGLMVKTVDNLCDIVSRFEDRKVKFLTNSRVQVPEYNQQQKFRRNENNVQQKTIDRPAFKRTNEHQADDNKRQRMDDRKQTGCFVCGSLEHFKVDCPKNRFRQCKSCKKIGHSANECRSTKMVSAVEVPSGQVAATIAGKRVNMLVDTGSEVSLIKSFVLKSCGLSFEEYWQPLKGFDGNDSCAIGRMKVDISFDNLACEIDLLVMRNHDLIVDGIIGRDFLFQPNIKVELTSVGISLTVLPSKVCSAIEFVDVKSDLVEKTYRERLNELLNKYKFMIKTGTNVSAATSGELRIRLSDETPIVRSPYRLAAAEREVVKKMIAELLRNNIIRESESPYASPITLVTKKNGQHRMCVDFRALNNITVKDRYPIPRIDDQIDALANAKWFSSLDMTSGFYQIPIAEDSIEKTGFVTPDGHYEFLRMPFGLANAPAVFQRTVNKALKEYVGRIAHVYMDDILIPAESIEDGFERLALILDALNINGFTLNLDKCKFFQTKIEYLGRVIENGTVQPSKGKTLALQNAPVPTNVKQVRQFLGLAGYFRKFIRGFSTVVAPISSLLKKNVSWNWTAACNNAMKDVVNALTSPSFLCIYETERETELHTDASSIGVGAVLMQKHDCGMRVVAYYSRKLTLEESKYHSYEQETMAIINALQHFRVYLIGKKFKVVTDCNAVKATATKKDIVPRVARWWVYMQDFDFDIVYRPGRKVSHVDYLSRNPPIVSAARKSYGAKTWLKAEQDRDIWVQTCKDILTSNDEVPEMKDYSDNYTLHNDVLYRKVEINGQKYKRWYVPKSARWRMLRMFHDDMSHLGFDRMVRKMAEVGWFPRMNQVAKKYVKHCLDCAHGMNVSGKKSGLLNPIPKIAQPFDTIHLDHMGPMETDENGFKYILTMVDSFTKFVILTPTRTVDVEAVVSMLEQFIDLFGVPRRIIADRGGAFTSKTFDEFCVSNGIEKHITATAMPRANGQVERFHKIILSALCTMVTVGEEHKWSKFVKPLQADLNATQSKATSKSPIELLMGYKAKTRGSSKLLSMLDNDVDKIDLLEIRRDAKRLIGKNQLYNKSQFDKKRMAAKKLNVGDFVMISQEGRRNKKLSKRYRGPYKVDAVLANDRYELSNVESPWKRKPVMAFESLKMWPESGVIADLVEDVVSIILIKCYLLKWSFP